MSTNADQLKAAYKLWNDKNGLDTSGWLALISDRMRITSMGSEHKALAFAGERNSREEAVAYMAAITKDWSMVHFTPAALAIARKCSTAFVEPPVAMISDTAFSIDLRVMMSRGFKSRRIASISTAALCAAESAFSASGEAICELPSRLMPSASNDELIVLAVYIPPQAPTVGQALRSMPS